MLHGDVCWLTGIYTFQLLLKPDPPVLPPGGRSAGSSLCADCGLSESSLEAVQVRHSGGAR